MLASSLKTTSSVLLLFSYTFIGSVSVTANVVLYRVNAGRDSSYTDTSGNFWDADTNYISSNTTNSVSSSTPIAGAADPTIYRTERNGASSTQQLRYVFAVNSQPDDEFLIRLHFADLFSTSQGQRLFTVWVNERLFPALTDIDVVKQAGGSRKALVKEVVVKGSDVFKYVNLKFAPKINNPIINAIEVIKIKGSVAPKQLPLLNKNGKYYKPIYLMNAGGQNYKNYFQQGKQWTGGFQYSNTGLPYRREVLNQIANDSGDRIIYNTARIDKIGTPELV